MPLNDRQLEVLKAVDASTDLSDPEHSASRRSALVLRDRGLISISKRGGLWRAEMTEAGRFYVDHGHHPDDPRNPVVSDDKPETGVREVRRTSRSAPLATIRSAQQRRAEAEKLVEHLVADELMVVKAPTDEEIDRWRKVVDFAKRHGMVPEGHHVEKIRQWNQDRDLHIRLVKGLHANTVRQTADNLPSINVPETLRAPHPVVAELRDDSGRLMMPKDLRRRCLLVLQGLAAEATNRGHKITARPVPSQHHHHYYGYGRSDGPRYSRREGEFDIVISDFSYAVTIQQVSPQSADPEKAERLSIELPAYRSEGRQYRWADGKRRTIEDGLAALLHEAETRAVEDRQRQIDEENAKAQRKVQWERAMREAQKNAVEAHYATILTRQAERWRHADDLRSYCQALEQRLNTLDPTDAGVSDARQWLSWARDHLAKIDPLSTLPRMPDSPKISSEDLKPYLKGWSPYGPEAHLNSWQK